MTFLLFALRARDRLRRAACHLSCGSGAVRSFVPAYFAHREHAQAVAFRPDPARVRQVEEILSELA
jgi:hypothetical protein